MGPRLGRAIRARIAQGALPWPLLPAGECIRATALGASEYSVQLSGNTSYISAPGVLLPRRNLQVLQPPFVCEETIDPAKLAAAIRSHMTAFDCRRRPRDRAGAALARHAVLRAARRLRRGHQARARRHASPAKQPLYIMLDGDVAQTLGAHPARGTARRERDAGDRRRGACGISTTSISAASACRPTPCRSPSSRWCSAKTRAARGRASGCIITTMITTMRTVIRMIITIITVMITIMITTTIIRIITTITRR